MIQPSKAPCNDALAEQSELADDSQIISRLRAKGTEEFSALFERMRDQLKAMIAGRLDRRLHCRVDASDIVQETFVRAANGLATYLESPKVHPVVWLRLIGKHLVAETHRRHFRQKRTPDTEVRFGAEEDQLLVNFIADSLHSVHTALEREETVKRVFALMQEMPKIDREVLEMRHTEEMTLIEIADTLEIKLETAKKRYHRALGRFRELALASFNQ
ncbi:sigma-70 family RNA polymerase sigma factor [Stieleria varia]|uniref:ECF RNA polymerase sigma factor SigW n=1 Tax=Stieleria varia TaxID=2528005 RepID=A0A5C6AZE7_9BACT|nr:sigma-70 family RNA polymerase sigma factor [Stieleria varia]TWU05008.1 ECF RNA polymerase sigma factor SigW [Stieleria varia]